MSYGLKSRVAPHFDRALKTSSMVRLIPEYSKVYSKYSIEGIIFSHDEGLGTEVPIVLEREQSDTIRLRYSRQLNL